MSLNIAQDFLLPTLKAMEIPPCHYTRHKVTYRRTENRTQVSETWDRWFTYTAFHNEYIKNCI